MRRSTDSDTDDDQDDDGSKTIKTEITNDVYDRYNFDRILPDLPIVAMRDFIMKKIRTNPVIILEGATGCGKTTQVNSQSVDPRNSLIEQLPWNLLRYHNLYWTMGIGEASR